MGDARSTNCQVSSRARAARTAFVLALVALTVMPGCVRRRLNIRSNPPGALVYVDNQQIGTTPCSVDFTYYGTREIRLIKAGYETLTVNQPIPTPWYQIPPLDFVSENLVPTKIRDNRTVMYQMQPQIIVPTPELIERANELRRDTLQYPVQPAAVVTGGTVVVPAPGPTMTVDPFAPPPAQGVPMTVPTMSPPSAPVTVPQMAPQTVPQMTPPAGSTTAPTFGPPQMGPPIVSPPLR